MHSSIPRSCSRARSRPPCPFAAPSIHPVPFTRAHTKIKSHLDVRMRRLNLRVFIRVTHAARALRNRRLFRIIKNMGWTIQPPLAFVSRSFMHSFIHSCTHSFIRTHVPSRISATPPPSPSVSPPRSSSSPSPVAPPLVRPRASSSFSQPNPVVVVVV